MLSTIDRRAVLAGIVTASAIAAPTAVAASAAEPDPVYALIEDHRRAVAWLNEICRKSLLPDFCDPEDREVNLANDTLRNAGDALLFAPITTIAGAASLLSYCVEVSHMEVCDGDLGTWREGPHLLSWG